MSWGYVAVAAATVASSAYSSHQAGRASDAARHGADAATAEGARQYDQTRADLAPYRVTGGGALNQLGQLFGLPTTTPEQFSQQQDRLIGDAMLPGDATLVSTDGGGNRYYDVMLDGKKIGSLKPGGNNGRFTPANGVDIYQLSRQRQQQQGQQQGQASGTPDMSAFFKSPGYQFRRDEGTRGLERTAAARGGAFSGNALKALAEFNGNLASNEFGNYFNQLASIAGIGQTATNQTAAYGANAANQAGRNALYAGDARASGIENQANIIGQGVNGLAGLYGYSQQNKQRPVGGSSPDWQNFYFGGGG